MITGNSQNRLAVLVVANYRGEPVSEGVTVAERAT